MRTALYFGSYNPVHNGHIAIAEYVLEKEFADQLWMVVSPQNPLKSVRELAPFPDRLTMAQLAAETSRFRQRICVCDIERYLPLPSFTIHTLTALREKNPGCEFSILMGSDNLASIGQWKDYKSILATTNLLVYPRADYPAGTEHDRITVLSEAPLFTISSTEIREKIKYGECISSLVPAKVDEFIKRKHLYGAGSR